MTASDHTFAFYRKLLDTGGSINEIMPVGAEAGFDFPQLVISGNNILSVQIVCTMDQNSMKAIPLGCVLDQSLVNRNIASVGERQETTIPTTAEARRLAAALELFL